jgi:hypothetical protein
MLFQQWYVETPPFEGATCKVFAGAVGVDDRGTWV